MTSLDRLLGTAETPDLRQNRRLYGSIAIVAAAALFIGSLRFLIRYSETAATNQYAAHLALLAVLAAVLLWLQHRLKPRVYGTIAPVAAAALLVAYVPFFIAFVQTAATNPYAGHLIFVPVLAVGLLWTQHRDLSALPRRHAPAGIAVIGAAVVLLWVGYTTASVPLQAVSFVAALGGVALWLFGMPGVRASGFLLGFLLLMAPPPREAVSALAPAVQQFVASVSSILLRVAQIPVEQQGIFLLLPRLTLEVAEECAGLRFLPILFVLVAAFAHAVLPTMRPRLVLIATSIPVAILANVARVAVTGAAAYALGPEVITGPAHYYIGKACWLLALLVMIGLACVLRARTGRALWEYRPPHVTAHAR